MSGAGTGTRIIQATHKLIRYKEQEFLLATTGQGAAGVGSTMVPPRVRPIGSAVTRAAGAVISVSGWRAPEFCLVGCLTPKMRSVVMRNNTLDIAYTADQRD